MAEATDADREDDGEDRPRDAARDGDDRDDARGSGSGKDKDGKDEKEDGKDDEKKKPNKKKRLLTIIAVVVLLLLGIAAGVAYYLHASKFVKTDDAFIDGLIVRIAAQQTGQLVELSVMNNARVGAGDKLAAIDPADARASLDVAKAQLAEAEAGIGTARANIVKAKATVQGAESGVRSARVTAKNSRTKADRYSEITAASGQTAISQQSLDDQLALAQEDEAAAAQADANLAQAQSQAVAADADLNSADAQVQAARATVEQNQVSFGKLKITAPIDGHVVQLNANIGSYVTEGTQIMALVPEHLYVTANYKETQLDQIRIGQKVDLRVDAFPDVKFEGTVQSIQRGAGQAFQLLPAQNATGNFVKVVQRVPVRISIDGPSLDDYPIGPGMSVVPSIRLED